MSLDALSELLATSPLDRETKLSVVDLASHSDNKLVDDLVALLQECNAAEGEAMEGLREQLFALETKQAATMVVLSKPPIKRQEDDAERAKKIEAIRRRILEM